MLKVQFRTRKAKAGRVTVYLRCVIDGRRWQSDLSTDIQGPERDWLAGEYRFKGLKNASLNRQIEAYASEVEDAARMLALRGELSGHQLHRLLKAKRKPAQTLPDLIEAYALHMGQGKSESTRKNYNSWASVMLSYGPTKGADPASISDKWLRKLDEHLQIHTAKPNKSAYSRRRKIDKLLACLAWAQQNDLLREFSLPSYKPKKESAKPPIYLTSSEVVALANCAEPETERVRDCFIFACYTGLAYSDQKYFDPVEHIITDEKGRKWIRKTRQKRSDCVAEIPLFPEAALLLSKYQGCAPAAPSNQEYNRTLKRLCALAGIRKKVTTHVARKTCATRLLNAGVNEHVIARFMGWKSTAMLKIYAQIHSEGIERELSKLGL